MPSPVAPEASHTILWAYQGKGSARACLNITGSKQVLAAGTIGQIRQISVTCCVDMRLLWQEVTLSEGIQNWLQSSELINAFVGDLFRSDNWHFTRDASGGGTFVDIGTHVMDLMLWLAGSSPPTQVVAFNQPLSDGLVSVVNTQAKLANGATLSLTFNDGVSGGDFDFSGHGRLSVYGDRGLLTTDWTGFMVTEGKEIWVEHDGIREQVEPESETITPTAAFVATILDDVPNIAPALEAAQVVALTEATYRSIEAGNIIKIS